MKISAEPLTNELITELLPLCQACWDECSEIKQETCAYHGQRGLPVDPNWQQYLALQSINQFTLITARDNDGMLHGFAFLITYYSLHLQKELCGNVDAFYLQPEHRQCMPRFMSTVEDTFRSSGVSIVGWPVTMAGKLFEILKKRGYIADDVVMELKLKDLPVAGD